MKEEFNRDGYVVRSFYKTSLAFNLTEDHLKAVHSRSTDQYIGYLRTIAKTMDIQKLFTMDHVVKALLELGVSRPSMPTGPVMNVMSPGLRIPGGYDGTKAHQDWPSVQGSLDMVVAWIALTDISKDNYPLEVIPGSHLDGLLLPKYEDGHVGNVMEVDVDESRFVPIECKAGDVVFLSGFLVHRTGHGNRFRAAVSQRFDNANDPSFISRGYPCAQTRTVEREILWYPPTEEVRSVYVD